MARPPPLPAPSVDGYGPHCSRGQFVLAGWGAFMETCLRRCSAHAEAASLLKSAHCACNCACSDFRERQTATAGRQQGCLHSMGPLSNGDGATRMPASACWAPVHCKRLALPVSRRARRACVRSSLMRC